MNAETSPHIPNPISTQTPETSQRHPIRSLIFASPLLKTIPQSPDSLTTKPYIHPPCGQQGLASPELFLDLTSSSSPSDLASLLLFQETWLDSTPGLLPMLFPSSGHPFLPSLCSSDFLLRLPVSAYFLGGVSHPISETTEARPPI